jgi:hypothetical protein
MYTSIHFATLQFHFSPESNSSTLSKTTPVYENDIFIFSEEDFFSCRIDSLEIKAAINKKYPKEFIFYGDMIALFQWHLN